MAAPVSTPVLVHTKLNRPRIAVELVVRDRLYAMLDGEQPLIVVTAPAGYGKTTLLSDWVAARQLRCAWLSLDANDNDLGVFLQYVAAALAPFVPAVDVTRIGASGAGVRVPLPTAAHWLAEALDANEEQIILVLDDYHVISEPEIHLFLAQLLRYPPACLRLVIVSRVDPPLQLAALRARGKLAEIRTRDLRFTDAETTTYLARELNGLPEPEIIENLIDSTEGWVAGLHLAALLLRNADAGAATSTIQRHRRLAIDYLAVEVFAQQPSDVQAFLLKTSILQRMCPSLCDAVLPSSGHTPAKQMLAYLEQQDLFVFALDDVGQWFRYHHLFQRFLRHMLESSTSPEELTALHRTAATWCCEQGLIDEAISYFLQGNRVEQAAALVEQHRQAAMNREDWAQLARWLHLLPRAAINTNLQFLLLESWVLHKYERLAELPERLDLAAALLDGSTLPPATQAALCGEIDALRSQFLYLVGEPQRANDAAQRALAALPLEYASARGLAWIFYAGGIFQLQGLQPALDTLGVAAAEDRTRSTLVTSRVLIATCFLYWMAADLPNLLATAEDLRQLAVRNNWPESRLWAHYFQGTAHYQLNNLPAARSNFAQVVQEQFAAAGYAYVYSSFGLAAALHGLGERGAAQAAAAAVMEHAHYTSDHDLRRVTVTFQAQLAAYRDEHDVAFVRAASGDRNVAAPMHTFFDVDVALIDLLVRIGTPACRDEAERRVSKLERRLAAEHNHRFLIEVLILKAILGAAQQPANARAALEEAIRLAQPGGVKRTFLDAPPALDSLLGALHLTGAQAAFVQEIKRLRASGEAKDETPHAPAIKRPVAIVQPHHPDLVELLTQRELEVLQLLALRLTNKEIALALSISTGTVKQHTRSVFQKLHADNRRDAIVQARSMGFRFDASYPA
jgi:LuxR family maltose regulon positive regulatory protein